MPVRPGLTALAEAATQLESSAAHAQRDGQDSAKSVEAGLVGRAVGFAADSAAVLAVSAGVGDSGHEAAASVAAGWSDAEDLDSALAARGAPREPAAASAKLDAAAVGAASVGAVGVDVAVVGAAAAEVFVGSGARSDPADHRACREKAADHEGTAAVGSLGAGPGIALAEKECGLAARCQCSERASWPRLHPNSSASWPVLPAERAGAAEAHTGFAERAAPAAWA
jgi:hypothetical protein